MNLADFEQYVSFRIEPRYVFDGLSVNSVIETRGSLSIHAMVCDEESLFDESVAKNRVLRELHGMVAYVAPDVETCVYHMTPEGSYLCTGCKKLSPFRLNPGMHCIHCGRVIERIEE